MYSAQSRSSLSRLTTCSSLTATIIHLVKILVQQGQQSCQIRLHSRISFFVKSATEDRPNPAVVQRRQAVSGRLSDSGCGVVGERILESFHHEPAIPGMRFIQRPQSDENAFTQARPGLRPQSADQPDDRFGAQVPSSSSIDQLHDRLVTRCVSPIALDNPEEVRGGSWSLFLSEYRLLRFLPKKLRCDHDANDPHAAGDDQNRFSPDPAHHFTSRVI